MQSYQAIKKQLNLSVGESVRFMREWRKLSQHQLAHITGIPQGTISAIEHGRVNIGLERAKVLARALKCHPAELVFPDWNVEQESKQQHSVA